MPPVCLSAIHGGCTSLFAARTSSFTAPQLRAHVAAASRHSHRVAVPGRLRVFADASQHSARELKKALSATGVSVADCFEKADLVKKYDSLSKAQQKEVESLISSGAGQEASAKKERAESKRAASDAGTGAAGSAAAAAAEATPMDKATAWLKESFAPLMAGPQEGVQRLQSALQEQQRAWQNGEISAKAQRRFDELDEQVGIRTKARMASQAARTAAVKIDSKLGITPFLRANGPPFLRAFGEFRETPVGQLLSFCFTAWRAGPEHAHARALRLFWSGVFWNILSVSLVVLFIFNLVAPTLLEGWIRKQAEEAQARMGGAAGPGGPSGMGGMGGGSGRMGGMGGMGGPDGAGGAPGAGAGSSASSRGRGTAGSASGRGGGGGSSAPANEVVIDVEAQVKDT